MLVLQETILKCYHPELDASRKLTPSQDRSRIARTEVQPGNDCATELLTELWCMQSEAVFEQGIALIVDIFFSLHSNILSHARLLWLKNFIASRLPTLDLWLWHFCICSIRCSAWNTNEPPQDKTNKVVCAPSEDSDQPGHPPSLIRVFDVRMKKTWTLSYPLSAQRRLWSDWAHMPLCWFCHEPTQISFFSILHVLCLYFGDQQ